MGKSVAKHRLSTSSLVVTPTNLGQEWFLNRKLSQSTTFHSLSKDVSKVNAGMKIELGDTVYYSTKPQTTLSNLLDWRIVSCTAAEQVIVTDDDITTVGSTLDLIKVGHAKDHVSKMFKVVTLGFSQTY